MKFCTFRIFACTPCIFPFSANARSGLFGVGWGGVGVFLLEVQYSILKSLISTCVLSYVGSREDWLLDRICESKKDCWDSIRRTSYPYQ